MTSPAAPDTPATRKVKAALDAAGMSARLVALAETARSAEEAASSLKVDVAAIVKTLIFDLVPSAGPLQGQPMPVAVLISGDRRCDMAAVVRVLGLGGKISRPDATRVKDVTGYSIGGVSPAGLPEEVVVLIDSALSRSETVWAAAGHTHLVFGCSFAELERLTGGRVTGEISMPASS
ncbi:YbaK/EbsC family protein [Alphaproteobacteria bacterium LSUCC0684]